MWWFLFFNFLYLLLQLLFYVSLFAFQGWFLLFSLPGLFCVFFLFCLFYPFYSNDLFLTLGSNNLLRRVFVDKFSLFLSFTLLFCELLFLFKPRSLLQILFLTIYELLWHRFVLFSGFFYQGLCFVDDVEIRIDEVIYCQLINVFNFLFI